MRIVTVRKNATLYDIMHNGIEVVARDKYNENIRITKEDMHHIQAGRLAAKKSKATGFIVVVAGNKWNVTTG